MRVASNERKSHVVGNPQSFIDFSSSSHAPGSADGAEPIDVVFDNKKPTRGDQSCEHVVVMRKRRAIVDLGVEQRREPHVFADNLAGCLNIGPGGFLRI
jgi:hypothetical protein